MKHTLVLKIYITGCYKTACRSVDCRDDGDTIQLINCTLILSRNVQYMTH